MNDFRNSELLERIRVVSLTVIVGFMVYQFVTYKNTPPLPWDTWGNSHAWQPAYYAPKP